MKDYIQIGIEKGIRDTAMLYFGGAAGQQCVPSSYLENFDLPLPPKGKKMEISGHIYQLRQQAKTLQEEDKRVLEETKQEVERMILSENS